MAYVSIIYHCIDVEEVYDWNLLPEAIKSAKNNNLFNCCVELLCRNKEMF